MIYDDPACGKVFYIEVLGDTDAYAGTFKNWTTKGSGSSTTNWLVVDDGTELQYVDEAVEVVVNGVLLGDEDDLLAGDECLVTLGADGKVVNVGAKRIDGPVGYLKVVTKSDTAANGSDIPTQLQIEVDTDGDVDFTMTVPKTALVTVNGAAVDRDTLAKYDAVYILTDDPDATLDDGNIVEIRAVRQAAEGTVAGSTVSYPGPVRTLTIGDDTYTWNTQCLGTTLPGKGTLVKYGLDAAGKLFVPIAYDVLNPYVLLKGWVNSSEPSSGSSLDQLIVDNQGTEVTYGTDGDDHSSAEFGTTFGVITLNTGTNQVTAELGRRAVV